MLKISTRGYRGREWAMRENNGLRKGHMGHAQEEWAM